MWDLFISHASEDKDSIARPLYQTLIERGYSVWFDEATLALGDSLRQKIDEGLSKCRFGVVIVSPHFLSKPWPQRELDALVAREDRGGKVILPIWHDITDLDIQPRSPMLAAKLAARSSKGIDEVVNEIQKVIGGPVNSKDDPPRTTYSNQPDFLCKLPIDLQTLEESKAKLYPSRVTLGDVRRPGRSDVGTQDGALQQSEEFVRWVAGEGDCTLAIAVTDIIDSTPVAQQYGDSKWIPILTQHLDHARALVWKHGGHFIKNTGDGIMAAFRSASQAVKFAAALEADPGSPILRIRAGVHVGPMHVRSGDTYGKEVHAVSRVTAKAATGGICVSDRAYDDCLTNDKQMQDLPWVCLGEVQLKGFSKPYTLWQLPPTHPARPPQPAPPVAADAMAQPTIEPFQTSLPVIGRTEVEMSEKLVLYGGRPEELVLGFTAIHHAVARHSFDREVVARVREAIETCDKRFASYTIASPPGGGLSMSLAQLVRDLHTKHNTRVLWIVGDKEGSECALASMSTAFADRLYAAVSGGAAPASCVVIVVDDVSETTYSAKSKLLAFARRCEALAGAGNGPRLALVFGSVGAARTLSEDATFQLKLTRADRQRCFDRMTHGDPTILAAAPDGLDAILSEHPEVRSYEDDARAFIDYLMEHGEPTLQAKAHWLARIDDEHRVLTRTAAAQLIGLHVEERVALQEFGTLVSPGAQDLEQIVRRVGGLAIEHRDWKGLGLSSARRARSILVRADCFNEEFIEQSLSEFLAAAIRQFGDHGRRAAESADFARHIFQRLGKGEFYQFPNKAVVARRLLQRHASDLREALASLPAAAKARWAGTLSKLEWPRGKGQHERELSQGTLPESDLLCDLCEHAVAAIYWGEESARPEILVGLYRAGRRIMRPVRGAPESRGRDVCNSIRVTVTDDMFWQAVKLEAMRDDEKAAYRANELVHARTGFEAELRDGPPRKFYERIEAIYETAESLLVPRGLALDAANWLRRSAYVWIPRVDTAGAKPREALRADRAAALAKRAEFLANAKRCVKEHADSQGTWLIKVDSAVRRFLRDNPGFAGYLTEPR